MRIAEGVTGLVGGTPLIRLRRVAEGTGATLLAKLEMWNPSGSVKDRAVLAALQAAEAQGRLAQGGCVVEATSGNTGIALACLCAARGYRLILTMPDTVPLERRALLRAYGAELVLTPAPEGMKGAVERAEALAVEIAGAWLLRQFKNPDGAPVHARGTAEEIWQATGGEVGVLVAGVGTGATLTGVGGALKERRPGIRVVAVEPAASPVLSGGRPGPHRLQGIGPGFVPPILDRSLIDAVVAVSEAEASAMARRLAREEGLLAGISAGAAVHAALSVARPGEVVVAILADSGERHIPALFSDYM